ncbi:hypothetical protein SIL81_21275 [Xanthomonas campestris pv. incanae]|uniref:DUF2442 domain-containing protein n=1 Tax=Xanthomonas campestris TaxID=339 RepID=UPI0029C1264B|nr:DUF2442 domain-containing protein [Xanthomonas campestris]MDX6082959.1 hypothetical protein [Xanthomonas campestris pv. incanae]MDX6087203.1 hypothetical protein [Xanthomonas campestris pv. incanae]MDX6141665.1 hypothetical protein [Xanthomonas campestris pv. incanae]
MRVKAKVFEDIPVTEAALEEAILRGKKSLRNTVRASSVRYVPGEKAFSVSFPDNSSIHLPVSIYEEFSELSDSLLENVELGFAGSAVVLEERDLHVSIAGLIEASKPLRDVVAAVHAGMLGSKKSEAKANASRANGALGGRPRKPQAAY